MAMEAIATSGFVVLTPRNERRWHYDWRGASQGVSLASYLEEYRKRRDVEMASNRNKHETTETNIPGSLPRRCYSPKPLCRTVHHHHQFRKP